MAEPSGTLGANEIISRIVPLSRRYRHDPPESVTDVVLANLIDEGLAFTASPDPFQAAQDVREAGERVVILPLEHRIPSEKSNKMVKTVNPDNYLYIDSAPVLRQALRESMDFAAMANKEWGLPEGISIDDVRTLTDRVAQMTGIYPYFQIKSAVSQRQENPPIGFYWVPIDRRPRVITWMRAIKGQELYERYRREDFPLELDKEFYGDTIKCTVPSHSDPDKVYDFWWLDLPISPPGSKEQHSKWRRIEPTDNNPDSGYRGLGHKRRTKKTVFLTAYSICGYIAAGVRLRETEELGPGMLIQVNPVPLMKKQGRELVRRLREQTIVGRRGLNMTEMDYMIGADTLNNGYDHNFVNWTRS